MVCDGVCELWKGAPASHHPLPPPATARQYGFNLKRSNELPLARDVNDHRSPECAAITYPKAMPKVGEMLWPQGQEPALPPPCCG
jgi:hypothetical protein